MSIIPYNKENLEKLCKESYSYAEVLRKTGRAVAGGSQKLLKKKIAEYSIDVSHFTSKRWQHSPEYDLRNHLEEIFIVNSKYSDPTIKKYLISENLLPYKCDVCGCNGTWQGKVLSLQLHHKNGKHNDNRLENLVFLCPNCHAITDNYGGRNK